MIIFQQPETPAFDVAWAGEFGLSALENGQTREVFVAFIDRAVLVSSFRPNDDGSYGYFYGAGLRREQGTKKLGGASPRKAPP